MMSDSAHSSPFKERQHRCRIAWFEFSLWEIPPPLRSPVSELKLTAIPEKSFGQNSLICNC
jgi:hypothetical protein